MNERQRALGTILSALGGICTGEAVRYFQEKEGREGDIEEGLRVLEKIQPTVERAINAAGTQIWKMVEGGEIDMEAFDRVVDGDVNDAILAAIDSLKELRTDLNAVKDNWPRNPFLN